VLDGFLSAELPIASTFDGTSVARQASHVAASFDNVELCDDVAPARWLRRALWPWTSNGIRHVATLVPASYAAHGRVLHRAGTLSTDLRWAEIATTTGRRLGPTTQYGELIDWRADAKAQSPPVPWREPNRGSLEFDECRAMAEVLARHTSTPERCWFCLWEGYGTAWTTLNDLARVAPRVWLEHRACLLFRGPVSAATTFREPPWFQSPTLWWPEDRAWCVASELDIYSTYVAGSTASIDALAAHPTLEVIEVAPDEDIDHGPYVVR
jgi:hypothetical protein